MNYTVEQRLDFYRSLKLRLKYDMKFAEERIKKLEKELKLKNKKKAR